MGHTKSDHYSSPKDGHHGYVNGVYGEDLYVATYLRYINTCKISHILLSPYTLKHGFWRPAVTLYHEEKLGPNLSHELGRLTFRPTYFLDLCEYTNMSYKQIFAFMRRRKHFSTEVSYDCEQDWAGLDEEGEYPDKWDEPVDTPSFDEGKGADDDAVQRVKEIIEARDQEFAQALEARNAARPEPGPSGAENAERVQEDEEQTVYPIGSRREWFTEFEVDSDMPDHLNET